MDEPIQTLQHTQDLAMSLAIEYGPRVLTAVLILVVGFIVMRWLASLAAKGLQRFALEPPVRELSVRFVRLLVLALFLIMALQNLGIELLPLIAGLGIAGAAALNLRVSVAYTADIDAALAAIQQVLRANARVLTDPSPLVQTQILGQAPASLAARGYVQRDAS